MKQIPDAAVQAALDTWLDHEFDGTLNYPRMRNALTAALPHLLLGYEVKLSDDNIIDLAVSVSNYKERGTNGVEYEVISHQRIIEFARLLLSQIVTKPVDVASVRRQAFEEAAKALDDLIDYWKLLPAFNRAYAMRSTIKTAADLRALSAGPAQGEQSGITISALQSAHIERQKEWCPDHQPDLSFRGNEMAGEVGEACNVIKKLERERQGWRGSRSTKEELASELADVIHTAILCAVTAGVDLDTAAIEKFNTTSDKNNLRTRLPAAPTTEEHK